MCVLHSVCLGHTVNAASRLVNVFHRDYDSWGTVLRVAVKLKGQFAQNEHSVSSLLHFLGVLCTHKQDFRWVKEGISQIYFQAERPQCWHLDSRRGGGGISTSGWAPSSYLFDMRPWDTSVLFMWGNILQWLRKAKHCCVNVAILAFVVCFHVHTPGLRAKRWLMNRAVVSPVLGQQSGYGSRRHAGECAHLCSKSPVNLQSCVSFSIFHSRNFDHLPRI